MRYSGLMQAERRPASLSSVPNKRLRKQIVFEIGETIHSGPTLVVKEEPKDEDIEPNCVFPGDTRETPNILPDGDRPADIPSKRCSPRLLLSPCAAGSPALGGPVKSPECKVAAAAKIAADIDSSHSQTQEVKAEPCIGEACSSKNKSNVLEVATEALVPEDKVTLAAVPEVPNVIPVPKVSEAYIPEATDTKAAVPGDTKSEALVPESVDTEALVPEDTVAKAFEPEASEATIPKEKVTKVSDPEPHAESSVIEKSDITESAPLKDIVPEASVPLASVPEAAVIEAAIPEVIDAEAVIPETAITEATVTNITDIDGALPRTDVKQAAVPEEKGEELKFKYPENPGDTTQVAAVPEVSAPAHPHASLPNIKEENREMVRLIQEADGKIDSFCHKRSSRTSKRLGSTDFDAVEVKPDPISRNKRTTRTRRTSCRSDRSESEVSDSRSVADESLCCDMVDKTKRGKPKIGEPLQEEAATHVSAKYNGDVSSDLVNGTHKVKGRRISRTNSDESDCSSTSRSNGNIDHNGEKVDFSLLLEISAADRKKFESKKAKIRRKTADWTLISETEQYYNEKEEIMRNKNKPDSDSESDESDNCAENNDSKSECSDVSENTANHTRSRGKGRGKQTRTMDEDEEESKSVGKRIKDDTGQKMKSRRTVGSRTRKTRYDLTLLNDDDDDDENFFGFPVSTPLPQTPQATSTTGSSTQGRCKIKGNIKRSPEPSSSSGKSGRKRLSDAERFLRDNREYYHFQETTERLRRSTCSSAEKEKYGNGDDAGAQGSKEYTSRREEIKSKDSPSSSCSSPSPYLTRTRHAVCGDRRVTRSAGGIHGEAEDEKDVEEDEKDGDLEKERHSGREMRRCRDKNVAKEKEKEKENIKEKEKEPVKEKDKDHAKEREKDHVKEREKDIAVEKEKERDLEKEREKDSLQLNVKIDSEKEKEKGTVKGGEKDSREEKEDKDKENLPGKLKEKEIVKEDEKSVVRENEKDVLKDKDRDSTKEKETDLLKDKQKDTKKDSEPGATKDEKGETLPKAKGESAESQETDASIDAKLSELYFSFEGVPENECWFQTYQRFIDGIAVNEFVYDEDPLKFVLPYEMPSEYVRDFISMKKSLLSKKKNDLADLVRKSPRCHASTLALFSDIIPTKKTKVTSTTKVGKTAILKIDEASSDGTSTPGADSTKMQHTETIESAEELALLAMHIDHIIKAEIGDEDTSTTTLQENEMKESEEPDMKKTPPKKRGKKKRLASGSKSERESDPMVRELKLFESPFAHEVDPAFIASIPDEMKDFMTPENILARAAAEVVEDSCYCGCTDQGSCDEFSSADDNTEASSECVSLCDSETIDSSTTSEPKRSRSGKKRRKNLTGWPKAQKRRRTVAPLTSDDNDSAIGCDDLEPKKRGRRKKHNEFSFLEQTTAQKLAALAACDRRASPRKKASVLYMDTWPVRFRTQK
ncbi:myb-like protein X isoform X2 [Penaeus vannamei]|uniref:myb-like protein X isoform X2 n=1 Tax=Penaeus vannamei TaxID=6689 RepID=UPI000F692705|nr:uncharacterized protein LOC113808561 isoform X2 [Penaeus vannamei]